MATAIERLSKTQQREDTRRKILESAAQVFSEKGFYRSVVEEYAATVAQQLQAAVHRSRGLVAQVEATVATLIRSFQANRALAKIVLVDWLGAGAEFQGTRIALKAMLVEVLRGYLDRAVQDG